MTGAGSAPHYSVVIPLYNKGPFIQRALRSVLAQQVASIEVIVVNDASTDDGPSAVEAFDDRRIRLLNRDRPGAGGYAARNLGIAQASAEWIACLDADDEWDPRFLSTINAVRQAFPEAGMVNTAWIKQEPGGRRRLNAYAIRHADRGRHAYEARDYLAAAARGAPPACASATAIRRDWLLRAGGFPDQPGYTRGGDLDTWVRVIMTGGHGAWDPLPGAVYHREIADRVIRRTFPNPCRIPLIGTLQAYEASETDPPLKQSLRDCLRYTRRHVWLAMLDFMFVRSGTLLLGEAKFDRLLACYHGRHARA